MRTTTDGVAVSPVLRALLSEIVDYAGMFPPAALPLDEAIQNYARYRREGDAWMLSRFVIPLQGLEALEPHDYLFRHEPPFRFSVLGSAASGRTHADVLARDLEAVSSFERRHDSRVRCEAMEIRLPPDLASAPAAAHLARSVAARLEEYERPELELYLEAPWDEPADDALKHAAYAVAEANSNHMPTLGLKIRSGGTEAELFPPTERLARFIDVCDEAGVPFKATAGLHHPFRRHHASVQTKMHGFVNVFVGAALLHAGAIDSSELVELLDDEDAASFVFSEDGIAWRSRRLSPAEVEAGRRFARSFGSCSFDEPRDDLRALGIL